MAQNEITFAYLLAMYNQHGYSAAVQALFHKFHNGEISQRDYNILMDALKKLKG